ncbi:mannosyl-oligosaccharide 1,3-1,6-alpha-mannosidase activity protein [Kickxella alabastrina]|uniref:Mannosyl-oligosaccharide 1,3-1,6-alpha-mannosidase activity protein n=1 Tax=Kickxella alabastrina TaxID=61397 RepID=A0ACC1IF90_9FUNG|nr:mannosyl-oligosaccharide 1,3-1,6-alpha-mannosidase activity protein [Kickxella alabastrina]
MLVLPRRYVRGMLPLSGLSLLLLILYSNQAVLPFNKPAWMPLFGEPTPPTSRDLPRHHAPLPRNLTLHLVAHSHSDIGWNFSFQEYYDRSVHSVMRQVVVQLWKNARRRFTWGDLAFLDLWMDHEGDQPNNILRGPAARLTWRQLVRRLIELGRLDVVGGTYVSPDEGLVSWWANTAIVDIGHRTLAKHFNATTGVGWQVDNFGHFGATPHLLASSGYSRMVLGRMAFRDLYEFRSRSQLQFLWQSAAAGHQKAQLLTHFLSTHYGYFSKAFYFDRTDKCDADALRRELVRYGRRQVAQYPGHGHVMVMMGDDFAYVRAARSFACLDRLVGDAAAMGVSVRYSTPSEYFDAVQPFLRAMDARAGGGKGGLRLHSGDFYPYQDRPYEQYWSGILATRPYLKWLVRHTEHAVQHAEQLLAAWNFNHPPGGLAGGLEDHLEFARKQVAIGYHHDAITGTCTDQAFHDYARRLRAASRIALRLSHHLLSHGAANETLVHEQLLSDRTAEDSGASRAGWGAYSTAAQPEDEQRIGALDGVQIHPRDHLEVPPELCSSSPPSGLQQACVGARIVVSNAGLLSAQDQVVRVRLHTLDAALVDTETGQRLVPADVDVLEDGQGFSVAFLARQLPPLGSRAYHLVGTAASSSAAERSAAGSSAADSSAVAGNSNDSSAADSSAVAGNSNDSSAAAGNSNDTLRSCLRPPTANAAAGGASAVLLQKNGTRVHLSIISNRVRIAVRHQDGVQRVVWHELRQYFANPQMQASGAYIMHSFMLMYGIVFYVFACALCAGLGCAQAARKYPKLAWLQGPDVAGALGWGCRGGERAGEGSWLDLDRLGAGPGLRGDSEDSGRSLVGVAEEEEEKAKEKPRDRSSSISSSGISALALGAATGLLFTYAVAQRASIDLLTEWTTGAPSLVWLAIPAFLYAHTLSSALRWPPGTASLFITAAASATALALFRFPTWQSRPLHRAADPAMRFTVDHGVLCDTARVAIGPIGTIGTVAYALCVDHAPLLRVTALVSAGRNRELVGQFRLETTPTSLGSALGSALASALASGCRFSIFDGTAVTHRQYSRWTPVPGNYYPAVSHVALRDMPLTLHARQPMGVTCVAPNTLELMMHRSMEGNDFRGLVRPLVDDVPVAVTHFVDFGADPTEALPRNERINSPPLAFVMPMGAAVDSSEPASSDLSATTSPSSFSSSGLLRHLRFVGAYTVDSQSDSIAPGLSGNTTTLLPPLRGVAMYVRIQALPSAPPGGVAVLAVDLLRELGLLGNSDAKYLSTYVVVGGDWSIAPLSTRRRTETKVDHVVLMPGEQKLFKFTKTFM